MVRLTCGYLSLSLFGAATRKALELMAMGFSPLHSLKNKERILLKYE
jgi:hypothetical protein